MRMTLFRLTVLGVFASISSFSFSQELLPVMYDSTVVEHQIYIEGNAFQHSTSIYNEFTRKFFFGGEIGDDLSDRTWQGQNNFNRIGGGYSARIQYRGGKSIFKSNPNWSWMVNFSNEAHVSSEYSDDLFGLVFLGNQPFLGEQVDLMGASARIDQYWSIGGGFHNKKTKSFITLNAILPQNFFQANIDRGTLTFGAQGAQMKLLAEGEVISANSDLYFKGIGASTNFDFNIPFGDSSTFNGVIAVQGRNIGFYKIHKATQYKLAIDEQFSGFSISDLIGDSPLPSLMDTLGVSEGRISKYKLIPGSIQIGKIVSAHSDHKLQSFFGVRMYTSRVYRPLIFAGAHYQTNEHFALGAQLAYGGYGGLRLGFYLNYSTDNLVIGLGTEDLLGLVLKNQFGHSALIRLAWKF